MDLRLQNGFGKQVTKLKKLYARRASTPVFVLLFSLDLPSKKIVIFMKNFEGCQNMGGGRKI